MNKDDVSNDVIFNLPDINNASNEDSVIKSSVNFDIDVVSPSPKLCQNIVLDEKKLSLPSALSVGHLKNLYINHTINTLSDLEDVFLKESTFEISIFTTDSDHGDKNSDPFLLLLNKYVFYWSQWWHAATRLDNILKEANNLQQSVWRIEKFKSHVEVRHLLIILFGYFGKKFKLITCSNYLYFWVYNF